MRIFSTCNNVGCKLPQYQASLTQPVKYKQRYIFALFVPELRTSCMLQSWTKYMGHLDHPSPPPNSMMPKWLVLASFHLHHIIALRGGGEGGRGFIASIYFVQDCRFEGFRTILYVFRCTVKDFVR